MEVQNKFLCCFVIVFMLFLQILGQLGPGYRGSPGIEDLLRQCRDHLACSDLAVFVPQNAFMPAPGGLLLSSVSVRLFVSGVWACIMHVVFMLMADMLKTDIIFHLPVEV